MEERPRPRRLAPRWPATLTQTPLQPLDEPIALLVVNNSDPHAWDRPHGQIRPLPDLERHLAPIARDVLVPGGGAILYSRDGWHEDETIPYNQRPYSQGVYRYQVATGAVRRSTFVPSTARDSLAFASSPDGHKILVARGWTSQPKEGQRTGAQHLRLELSFADFTDTPAQQLHTLVAYVAADSDDVGVQWSPDGATIALSVALYVGEGVSTRCHVLLLDATSGEEIARLADVFLAGSVSWSPDSRHLLTMDRTRTLWTCDTVTGQRHLVPALPGPRPGAWADGHKRALGILDDQRLLIAIMRRGTMTISTLDRQTEARVPLVRWKGALDAYPTLTQMPPGYWNQPSP